MLRPRDSCASRRCHVLAPAGVQPFPVVVVLNKNKGQPPSCWRKHLHRGVRLQSGFSFQEEACIRLRLRACHSPAATTMLMELEAYQESSQALVDYRVITSKEYTDEEASKGRKMAVQELQKSVEQITTRN